MVENESHLLTNDMVLKMIDLVQAASIQQDAAKGMFQMANSDGMGEDL